MNTYLKERTTWIRSIVGDDLYVLSQENKSRTKPNNKPTIKKITFQVLVINQG